MVLQDLREEMFVPDFDLAAGPGFSDRFEQRCNPCAQVRGDAENRGVAFQRAGEVLAVESPAGVEHRLHDLVGKCRWSVAFVRARIEQQTLEIVIGKRNNITGPVTVLQGPGDQQQVPHLVG